jgi:iron complex transport system substrate-binding protein
MKRFSVLLKLLIIGFLSLNSVVHAAERIVSVGGDVTELVYALGSANKLVGIDSSSTFPASVQHLPQVGYQRNLSSEGILSLKPDLFIHNDLAGPPGTLLQLQATSLPIVVLPTAYTLVDLQKKVSRLGEVLNKAEAADQLNKQIAIDYAGLQQLNTQLPIQSRVVFVLNHGGGAAMVAGTGTAADAVINLAGAKNAADFQRYKPLTPEAMVKAAPDIILITDMTLRQIGGIEKVWALPGMSLTSAAVNKKIIIMDAQSLLSFGPRIFQVAADLHRQIHQKTASVIAKHE